MRILTRAVGPSLELNHRPIAGRLLNPTLELHGPNGALIFSNDDWNTSVQRVVIQETGLAPRDIREPAIVANLPPGNYTTVIRGKNNTAGIALGEIYALDQTGDSHLINLSARAVTLSGDNVLIEGVVVGGNTAKNFLFRALGPELHAFGVSGELSDPVLTLYDANGVLLRSNNDWRAASNRVQIQATGLAPTDIRESAILLTLVPGSYTAIVRGANGTTGVALAEVYMLR